MGGQGLICRSNGVVVNQIEGSKLSSVVKLVDALFCDCDPRWVEVPCDVIHLLHFEHQKYSRRLCIFVSASPSLGSSLRQEVEDSFLSFVDVRLDDELFFLSGHLGAQWPIFPQI